jgi:TolB-like protein/tetratricopeptide (TPR) repeat protein
MTIIAELKRRNVFRAAIYYLAVGWLVMQVTDVLTSVLDLPDWTGRLVFLLLVIGFPVALLLAWAFELTPEGLRRETDAREDHASPGRSHRKSDYLLIGMIALVVAAYAWNSARQRGPETVEPGQIRSVVVLPFGNLMNDPDQDYFVEGMHDALITQLSKINALHVISRTTAMHYAGTDKPLTEIARELNVDAVVEGSVLRAGDVVRITTQLIDARNDRHIWADNFDRELVDILVLYNEVTQEIAHQVRVTVTPNELASLEKSRPIDPEAYELYLKGRHLCGNWSPREMRQGAGSLQQAIQLAPDYAAPHAQLAMCLVDSAFFEYVPPDEIDSRARTAAMTAVKLDDRLAEAHVALGSVHYYLEFDPEAAEIEYLKALELNPNSVDTLLRLSWFYAESGRFDEAHSYTRRAVELDPLSTGARNAMGQFYYLSRDVDRAIQNFEEALNLDRSDPSLHYYVGLAYEQKHQYEKAIALFESATALSDRAPLYLSSLGYAYGRAGMRDRALEILEGLEDAEDPSPFNLAVVHLGLGDDAQALDLLERAYKARNMHLLYLKSGPRFDPLRDDPRFVGILEQMGW